MATFQDVRLQMRILGYSGLMLKRGETRELPNLLREGELIKRAVYGRYDGGFGMLVATSQRLLFIDRRFFHRHFSDIPYTSIGSVEFDSGLVTGCVRVYARVGDITLKGIGRRRARDFFNYIDKQIERHKDTGEDSR